LHWLETPLTITACGEFSFDSPVGAAYVRPSWRHLSVISRPTIMECLTPAWTRQDWAGSKYCLIIEAKPSSIGADPAAKLCVWNGDPEWGSSPAESGGRALEGLVDEVPPEAKKSVAEYWYKLRLRFNAVTNFLKTVIVVTVPNCLSNACCRGQNVFALQNEPIFASRFNLITSKVAAHPQKDLEGKREGGEGKERKGRKERSREGGKGSKNERDGK